MSERCIVLLVAVLLVWMCLVCDSEPHPRQNNHGIYIHITFFYSKYTYFYYSSGLLLQVLVLYHLMSYSPNYSPNACVFTNHKFSWSCNMLHSPKQLMKEYLIIICVMLVVFLIFFFNGIILLEEIFNCNQRGLIQTYHGNFTIPKCGCFPIQIYPEITWNLWTRCAHSLQTDAIYLLWLLLFAPQIVFSMMWRVATTVNVLCEGIKGTVPSLSSSINDFP